LKKVFRVVILEDHCKSCGLCVDVCPKQALRLAVRLNKLGMNPAEALDDPPCTGCGNCLLMCPDTAIQLIQIEEDD